ncbi:hypothetical protein [Scytonema hofmannii]|uniref:hypothetical protein n=1 Tax=Scytonema hofmannii TaxID=34078 RepID=UPI00034AC41B|nr:hypothetical protein [Scytonema hofmannii]
MSLVPNPHSPLPTPHSLVTGHWSLVTDIIADRANIIVVGEKEWQTGRKLVAVSLHLEDIKQQELQQG